MSAERDMQDDRASKVAAYQGKIYRNRDVFDIAKELYPAYPHNWVALAVLDEDEKTGRRTYRLVANEASAGIAGLKARRYRDRHPGTIISIFATKMGASPLSLLRHP